MVIKSVENNLIEEIIENGNKYRFKLYFYKYNSQYKHYVLLHLIEIKARSKWSKFLKNSSAFDPVTPLSPNQPTLCFSTPLLPPSLTCIHMYTPVPPHPPLPPSHQLQGISYPVVFCQLSDIYICLAC